MLLATTSSAAIFPVAHASFIPPSPPTLQEVATSIAVEHGISSSTLFNLVKSESDWQTDLPVTDHGCTYGIVQINLCAHPEITKEQALDPVFALSYAAQAIASNTESIWTSCNCYSLVWTRVHNLPRMNEIVPNKAVPEAGDVAIFYYISRETGSFVKHIAYITKVTFDSITILEANKDHCLVDTRVIHVDDPYLVGFWQSYAV